MSFKIPLNEMFVLVGHMSRLGKAGMGSIGPCFVGVNFQRRTKQTRIKGYMSRRIHVFRFRGSGYYSFLRFQHNANSNFNRFNSSYCLHESMLWIMCSCFTCIYIFSLIVVLHYFEMILIHIHVLRISHNFTRFIIIIRRWLS